MGWINRRRTDTPEGTTTNNYPTTGGTRERTRSTWGSHRPKVSKRLLLITVKHHPLNLRLTGPSLSQPHHLPMYNPHLRRRLSDARTDVDTRFQYHQVLGLCGLPGWQRIGYTFGTSIFCYSVEVPSCKKTISTDPVPHPTHTPQCRRIPLPDLPTLVPGTDRP